MDIEHRPGGGRSIFMMFLAFFGLIVAVDGVFTYTAIHTNTGVVTENAYEKGLAYNKVLEAAKAQPSLQDKMTYENGILQWALTDAEGVPLKAGKVTALFVRPIKEGDDFSLPLREISPGLYQARPDFPVKGLWRANLDVIWKNKNYQTTHELIAK